MVDFCCLWSSSLSCWAFLPWGIRVAFPEESQLQQNSGGRTEASLDTQILVSRYKRNCIELLADWGNVSSDVTTVLSSFQVALWNANHGRDGHCCKCCWWRISWSSVVVAVLCSSQMALQDAELWQMCMCGRCTVSVGSDGFHHQVMWLLHSLPCRLRFEMPIVVGGGHYYWCYSWWYISWSSDVTAAFSAYEMPVVMGGHYYGCYWCYISCLSDVTAAFSTFHLSLKALSAIGTLISSFAFQAAL